MHSDLRSMLSKVSPDQKFETVTKPQQEPTKYNTTIEDAPEELETDWALLENKDWENTSAPEWKESFKKSRCPHGTSIFSPEDECMTCVLECSRYSHAVNHVHLVDNRPRNPKPRKTEDPMVYIQPLNSKVGIPQLPHQGDAGFDLVSTEDILLTPGEAQLVPTGLAMEIPLGYFGKIESKSGLALAGLVTRAGVIDSSYRGEIKVIVENRSFCQYQI